MSQDITANRLRAFHGDPAIKDKFLQRVKRHRELDHLVQSYGYWNDGKGCAVGCTLELNENVHQAYPEQLGVPEWLAHLEDHIFEALPAEDAQQWPEQFLGAIPTGAEIPDSLRDRFQVFWLERQKSQINCQKYAEVETAIDGVIALLNQAIGGAEPESAAWSAAWSAARSAARSAAESEAQAKRDWILTELKAL